MENERNIVLRRETTACFTGHRPEKLPDGGKRNSLKTRIIKSMLYGTIDNAVKDGYDTFITGMQRGVDLWAGEIVLSLMAKSNIRIICAIPYEGFGNEFTGVDRWTFERLLEAASAKFILSPKYSRECMALRNKFMVENSSRLIAVMDDPKSGTGQTVRQARSANLDIRILRPSEMFSDTVTAPDFDGNSQTYETVTFDGSAENMPAAKCSECSSPVSLSAHLTKDKPENRRHIPDFDRSPNSSFAGDKNAAGLILPKAAKPPRKNSSADLSEAFYEKSQNAEISRTKEKNSAEPSLKPAAQKYGKMPKKSDVRTNAPISDDPAAENSENGFGKMSDKASAETARKADEHSPKPSGQTFDPEIDERYISAEDPTLTLL